eukprot:COSAG02_NODE_19_length_53976_cov_37.338512_28_plen_149_part_00
MNGAVQLLIAEPGDNLPLPPNASTLSRAYSSNETLKTSLHVSNYGTADIPVSRLLGVVVWLKYNASRQSCALLVCYQSDLSVSKQAGSTLEWSVISTDSTGTNTTICHKSQPLKVSVPQGPGTTVVETTLHCILPNLGDFEVCATQKG